EVLVRRAAADRQLAAELVGAGNARQRLQRPERVVEAAGGREHLRRTEGKRCWTFRLLPWRLRRRHLHVRFESSARNQLNLERRHALRAGVNGDRARKVITSPDVDLPASGGHVELEAAFGVGDDGACADRHLNAGDGTTRYRVDDAASDGDRLTGGD